VTDHRFDSRFKRDQLRDLAIVNSAQAKYEMINWGLKKVTTSLAYICAKVS
jgi:hypothetical protein